MKKFNLPKISIDRGKALGLLVTGLGVVVTILNSEVESNNRKTMKDELKKELLEELTSPKN